LEIIIGLPAFNEEKNIASLIIEIQKLGYKVLVCDDHSSDNTGEISKKLGAIVERHSRNLGYGGSIQTLFSKSRELNADILVTFDADGQHNFNDIPSLIQPIIEKKSNLVIGSRFLGKKSKMPKYREVGINTLTKLANISKDVNVSDSQSGLRAYDKQAINSISPSEDTMGVSTEILIKAVQEKLKIIEIPVEVSYEGDTSTHNPAVHGLSVVATTFKLISIKHPLSFYGIPGFILLCIGLMFTVLTLSSFAETRTIITNQALLAVGSLVIGIVLLMTSSILFSIISVVRERR
jgi:glycosyltransferase involved in cell wall biosynthesis